MPARTNAAGVNPGTALCQRVPVSPNRWKRVAMRGDRSMKLMQYSRLVVRVCKKGSRVAHVLLQGRPSIHTPS